MFSQEIKTTCTLFSKEVHDCNYFFLLQERLKGSTTFLQLCKLSATKNKSRLQLIKLFLLRK